MKLMDLKRISKILLVALLLAGTAGMTGCKKKKELAAAEAAAAAELQAQIDQAKSMLLAILEDNTLDNVDANYATLDEVKAMNLSDPEVLKLVIDVQEKLADDKAALALLVEERLAAERAAAALEAENMKIENDKILINKSFLALSVEKDLDKANNIINNTLPMFSSPDAVVLIIVSEENGKKDYDRPTNIKDYLDYLKDRKSYTSTVEIIRYDDFGKISELELRKNF